MSSPARPLHFAKFVPPPYAGVEAHVDTLLRALRPEVQGTLVAGESPQGAAQEALPYRVLAAKSFGKLVANLPLSPGVLRQARRELASGRCNILAGCGVGSTTVDNVGVRVTYTHAWSPRSRTSSAAAAAG